MSTTNNTEALLCHYIYDPLNRLATCKLSTQMKVQRFYFQSRLATEVEGSVRRSIFQQGDQLLAQQQLQSGSVRTALLCTDPQRSVLTVADTGLPNSLVYSPYGQRAAEGGLFSLLGFNGERPDSVTGHYLLGNGYRAYNPVLMRFNRPDDKSPFGEGGLNAYAYCGGDPVNRVDPTGHVGFSRMLKNFAAKLGLRRTSVVTKSPRPSIASARSTTSLDSLGLRPAASSPPPPYPGASPVSDLMPTVSSLEPPPRYVLHPPPYAEIAPLATRVPRRLNFPDRPEQYFLAQSLTRFQRIQHNAHLAEIARIRAPFGDQALSVDARNAVRSVQRQMNNDLRR